MSRSIAGGLLFAACAYAAAAQDAPKVVVIRVDDGAIGSGGMIDYWLTRFVERKLADAHRRGAAAVIFEIDTGGGQLDAALEVSDRIMHAEVPTAAFIRNKAYSAGALVALSCRKIFMEEGSVMGSALPIVVSPAGIAELPEKAEEKMIRAVDKKFAAVAERMGHNAALARAMVDPALEVIRADLDGQRVIILRDEFNRYYKEGRNIIEVGTPICKAGEILNLTAREAVELGLAAGITADLEEVAAAVGFAGSLLVAGEVSWAEELARVLAGPIVSGLLIMLAIVGLAVELKTPGFGAGGAVFTIALALFFWGRFVAGAAEPLDVILFLVGFMLLVVELLFIPGFGVIGISGLLLMCLSLLMTYLPGSFWRFEFSEHPWRLEALRDALFAVLVPVAVAVIADVIIIAKAGSIPVLRHVVLAAESDAALAPAPVEGGGLSRDELMGREGVALTPLRPACRAEIAGRPLDVVTRGDFIAAGSRLRVVKVESTRIVVEEA